MRIADHPGDAFQRGDFFRSALRVTAGDNDARGGIRAMNLADGVARLRIGRGRDRAGVQHHDVGSGMLIEHLSPSARSERRSEAASASVARQPKFSMEKVAIKWNSKPGKKALSEEL